MNLRPVLGSMPTPEAARRPSEGKGPAPEEQYFRFSLRYWNQIEDFGVGSSDKGWFISLLNRLRDLCASRLEDVLEVAEVRDSLRIHDIDWSWRGVQIALKDLDWVPKAYLENQEEYPIMQIHVSKANGRIIGFFDEKRCFHIVLLDPNHNMQPSKFRGYKIRPTRIGECEVSAITARYELAISKSKAGQDEKESLLGAIKRPSLDSDVVLSIRLNASQMADLNQCLVSSKASDAGDYFIKCVEEYTTRVE